MAISAFTINKIVNSIAYLIRDLCIIFAKMPFKTFRCPARPPGKDFSNIVSQDLLKTNYSSSIRMPSDKFSEASNYAIIETGT